MTTFVGLLDLNPGSVVSVNGQPIVIRRDDFVGIKDIANKSPSGRSNGSSNGHGVFHLVTVRAAAVKSKTEHSNDAPSRPQDSKMASEFSTTVGFFIAANYDAFVRRYDAYTEEMSGDALVDDQTKTNLFHQVQNNQMEPQRVISYPSMAPAHQQQEWAERTKFISQKVLERRGIGSGDKLVPGAYHASDSELQDETTAARRNTANKTADEPKKIVDGKSPQYPCMPVWNAKTKFRVKRHVGTQKYLSKLSPAERTTLLLDPNPSSQLLQDIMKRYYDDQWQDMMGDLQLAFALFLNMRCFASLEHWRDLISMLCFVEPIGLIQNSALYDNLLQILSKQVLAIENEFFEDLQMSDGNFLLIAFETLLKNLSSVSLSPIALANFQSILKNKFPTTYGDDHTPRIYEINDDGEMDVFMQDDQHGEFEDENSDNEDDDDDEDELAGDDASGKRRGKSDKHGNGAKRSHVGNSNKADCEEDDDDDAPVVISVDEMEAAMGRTNGSNIADQLRQQKSQYSKSTMSKYPFLFAAMMPQEDVLMTCARALDSKTDVTLVREAAAYLEEVENGVAMAT